MFSLSRNFMANVVMYKNWTACRVRRMCSACTAVQSILCSIVIVINRLRTYVRIPVNAILNNNIILRANNVIRNRVDRIAKTECMNSLWTFNIYFFSLGTVFGLIVGINDAANTAVQTQMRHRMSSRPIGTQKRVAYFYHTCWLHRDIINHNIIIRRQKSRWEPMPVWTHFYTMCVRWRVRFVRALIYKQTRISGVHVVENGRFSPCD